MKEDVAVLNLLRYYKGIEQCLLDGVCGGNEKTFSLLSDEGISISFGVTVIAGVGGLCYIEIDPLETGSVIKFGVEDASWVALERSSGSTYYRKDVSFEDTWLTLLSPDVHVSWVLALVGANMVSLCCSMVYLEEQKSKQGHELLACDGCGCTDFGDDYDDLYHVSGVLRGENNNHIHLCGDCMGTYAVPLCDIPAEANNLLACYRCGHEFRGDYSGVIYGEYGDEPETGELGVLCSACVPAVYFMDSVDVEGQDA